MLPLAPLHAGLGAPAGQSPTLCRQWWAVLPWPGENQDPSLGSAWTQAGGRLGCQGLAAAAILPKSLCWHERHVTSPAEPPKQAGVDALTMSLPGFSQPRLLGSKRLCSQHLSWD